ncbi:hypothetical protein AB0C90_04750 [Streptomyces sp. NPDC048550]|uniref:hypothetical protein n=1 Tax=Streptomyces sp. NPDC048550 TaxID=3155739 RepID=UPI003415351B
MRSGSPASPTLGGHVRTDAARFLAERGDERAADLPAGLAADTALGADSRTWAARILAETGGFDDAGAR